VVAAFGPSSDATSETLRLRVLYLEHNDGTGPDRWHCLHNVADAAAQQRPAEWRVARNPPRARIALDDKCTHWRFHFGVCQRPAHSCQSRQRQVELRVRHARWRFWVLFELPQLGGGSHGLQRRLEPVGSGLQLAQCSRREWHTLASRRKHFLSASLHVQCHLPPDVRRHQARTAT
jgi:hypothetical protein